MKISCILFAFLFSYSPIVFGQKESIYQRIDQHFQGFLEQSPAPGFSAVVVRGDQVIFEKGYGLERSDMPTPMTTQSAVAAGSLTKSFTALALMQLAERGIIRLDDPVVQYLPDFRTANKKLSDKITVRMLLNNTSGLPGGVSQRWLDKGESLEKLMRSLESFYLKKEPGSSYEYSNTAFSIAGLIISRASGLSYSDYLKQHIFHPLEMRSTTDPKDFDRLPALYGHRMGIDGGIPAFPDVESIEMIPAGSTLRSSAADLGRYLIALLNDGVYRGRRLTSSQSIAAMWSPQINFPGLSYEKGGDGKDFHYGLGWMISEIEGRTLIHHGGSAGTASSMTILFPEARLAAAILINLDYNFIDRYRFQSEFQLLNNLFHLLQDEKPTNFGLPRVSDPSLNDYILPTSLQERFLGTYWFSGQGDGRNFQGVRLEVFRGQDGGLEAQAKRGEILLTHFKLDFINPVNAFSRNIGVPRSIQFKVRPDGKTAGLFFAGSEFIKLTPTFFAKYQALKNTEVSFYFSKDWNWTFEDRHFQAIRKDDPQISLTGGQIDGEAPDLTTLFQRKFPQRALLYQGIESTEARGSHFWRQQSFAGKRVGTETVCQSLILLNETQGFYLILTTPFGKLSKEVQNSLSFLMDTFVHLGAD